MRAFRKILLVIMATLYLSCGVYSFSGSGTGDIKTIAVPLFGNETTESGLRELLTDQLSQAYITDNAVKVASEQQADGIVRGTVTAYSRDAYTYDKSEVVSQYICRVTVKVEFVNRKSGKVIWSDNALSNWGTYDSATESEDIGKQRAIAKLVEDIVNKTVKGW